MSQLNSNQSINFSQSAYIVIANKVEYSFDNFDDFLIECLIMWNETIEEIVFVAETKSNAEKDVLKTIKLYKLNYDKQFVDIDIDYKDYQNKTTFIKIRELFKAASRATAPKKNPKIIIIQDEAFNEKKHYMANRLIKEANQKGFQIAVLSIDNKCDIDRYKTIQAITNPQIKAVSMLCYHFDGKVVNLEEKN